METTIHSDHADLKRVALAAFPGYSGRKFKITVTTGPVNCTSYWSGGSKDTFNFVHLETLNAFGELPPQSAFDKPIAGITKVPVVFNLAIVSHSYFCGKDMGLTVYVHPDNAPKFLPAADNDLTSAEKIVLYYTSRYKNSYAGRKHCRYREANREQGISRETWLEAQQTCIEKKLLNKARAITNSGRNAIADLGHNRPRFDDILY